MTVEISLEKTYTLAEFLALPDDGKNYELVRGKLVEKMAVRRHGRIGVILSSYLFQYTSSLNLGEVYDSTTSFVLDAVNDIVRMPDVSFVTSERLAGLPDDEILPIAPDLAVEVLSDSNYPAQIAGKLSEYQQAGVHLIWIIDPEHKTLKIYHGKNTQFRVLTVVDELDGEDVLPGFKLAVSKLFKK